MEQVLDQSASLFDVLASFFSYENAQVRALALEVFIRRSYRTYDITEITSLADTLVRMQWILSQLLSSWQELLLSQ